MAFTLGPPPLKRERFLGIDPGLGGAWAIIEANQHSYDAQLAPLLPGTPKTYDIRKMFEVLSVAREVGVVYAAIEKGQTMPGNSPRSGWKMGFGHGLWQALLHAVGIPYTILAPRVWQKSLGIVSGTDTKTQSILIAKREIININLRPERARKDNDGIADAACLALCARRTYLGQIPAATNNEPEEGAS